MGASTVITPLPESENCRTACREGEPEQFVPMSHEFLRAVSEAVSAGFNTSWKPRVLTENTAIPPQLRRQSFACNVATTRSHSKPLVG